VGSYINCIERRHPSASPVSRVFLHVFVDYFACQGRKSYSIRGVCWRQRVRTIVEDSAVGPGCGVERSPYSWATNYSIAKAIWVRSRVLRKSLWFRSEVLITGQPENHKELSVQIGLHSPELTDPLAFSGYQPILRDCTSESQIVAHCPQPLLI
jgi:hypothetical protein